MKGCMFHRKRIKIVSMILFCFVLISSSLSLSFAGSKKPKEKLIKVGYTSLQGFMYKKSSGGYTGLAYDLLQEIGMYNNWKYKFVETSYAQCEKQLEDGTIDIFIPYQRTPEREKIYEYSNHIFCTNRASLLTAPRSSINYNDFDDIDGKTIGVAIGTRNGDRFQKFFLSHGCKIKLKQIYRNQKQMIQAMNKGEIDAFISASNRGITDCKIVSVLDETNSYVIAKKGERKTLDKVDAAIDKIELNTPNFLDSLNEKYQAPDEGSYPALTEEEVQYLKNKKQVTVLLSAQECDKDGNFTGSAKTLFDQMEKMTGVRFVPKMEQQTSKILSDFTAGKTDVMYSFNSDYEWAILHNAWVTNPYATFYNKLIKREDTNTIKKVAVVPGSYIEYYVKNELKYDTISCKTYSSCIDKVKKGEVDATYCNAPIGNYYSTFPKYRSLQFLSSYDFKSAYCMAVSKSSDQILISIIDKSINCISESVLSRAFEQQTISRQVSFVDVIYSNPVSAVIMGVVGVLVIGSLIFTLVYTRGIQRKNQQLEVANRAKTDFLSRMSHDMRTPMNGILGLTELAKDEKEVSKLQEDLEQIDLSGHYLLNLINDTLDMNKIESGRLELHQKPLKSEDLFSNIISNASMLAQEKGIHLQLNLPEIPKGQWIPVIVDASRIEQVLINIISNAVKFTPPDGTVELKMETLSVDDEFVKDRYIIRDTGIGMSEAFLPHLFEPFAQEGRSQIKREEGTGLGMSIVKQLVELMGGRIEVESHLNEGTQVTIYMQYVVYHGDVEDAKNPEVDLTKLKGKHILVCEDHPINSQITMKLLDKKGMTSELAVNGEEGLERFKESKPGTYDLILMDIRMPKLDGIETTKEIRKMDREDAKSIPIIAMTANAFDDDVLHCLDAGMNAHLGKPVNSSLLYETIAVQLNAKQEV